jgi:hypothetical protein
MLGMIGGLNMRVTLPFRAHTVFHSELHAYRVFAERRGGQVLRWGTRWQRSLTRTVAVATAAHRRRCGVVALWGGGDRIEIVNRGGSGSDHLHRIHDLPRRVGIRDADINRGGTVEHRVQVARHLLRILCLKRLFVLELSRRNVEAPGFKIRETAMNGTATWNMSSQGFQVDHRLVVVLGGQ